MGIFSVIRAETRVTRMIQWFSGRQSVITDFVVGGITRSKMEAVAVVMEEQDYNVAQAIETAIKTAVYDTFNFPLLPPSYATGQVTFYADPAPSSAITISAGTQVATATGITYTTTAQATIAANASNATAPVIASTAGTAQRVADHTLNILKSAISGVTSVTNLLTINNGSDYETEAQRQIRFASYIQSLNKATDGALEYGARQAYLSDTVGNITERVTVAKVVPATAQAPGVVTVYVYKGSAGTSDELVAKTQKIIDGYRDASGKVIVGYKAAGDIVTVTKVTEQAIDVSATITTYQGADQTGIKAMAESAVAAYISGLGIGDKILHGELTATIMAIPGVYNVGSLTPGTDTTQSADTVALVGAITITMASL